MEQLNTDQSTHPSDQDLDDPSDQDLAARSHSHTPSLWSPIPQTFLRAYGVARFDSWQAAFVLFSVLK